MRLADARRPRAATLLERTLAYLADSLVTAVIWLGLVLVLARGDLSRLGPDDPVGVVAAFLFLLVPFVYFVLAETISGTTVGKRLLGLYVRTHDDAPAGLFAVTVRNTLRLAWALGPIGPLFLAADAVLIQQTEEDQRAGDLAAETRVIRQGSAVIQL